MALMAAEFVFLLLVLTATAFGIWWFYWNYLLTEAAPDSSTPTTASGVPPPEKPPAAGRKKSSPAKAKMKGRSPNALVAVDRAPVDHPRYVDALKLRSSGVVTCCAVNNEGNALAVTCTDGTVRLVPVGFAGGAAETSPFSKVGGASKRLILDRGDVATALDFSHDGKFVFVALEYRSNLARLSLESDGNFTQSETFDTPLHKQRVCSLTASAGPFIVTKSEAQITEIKVWGYDGLPVATVDTNQIRNCQLACAGTLFGSAAWTAGIKLFDVGMKGGSFTKTQKVMDLKTSCGTLALAITQDAARAALLTKNGDLLLWNIGVRYQASEDPKKLVEASHAVEVPANCAGAILAFTADGGKLILAVARSLHIFDAKTLKVVDCVSAAHGMCIDQVLTPRCGGPFFMTTASDERPRAWRVP